MDTSTWTDVPAAGAFFPCDGLKHRTAELFMSTACVADQPKRHVSRDDHSNPDPLTVTHVSALALDRGEIDAIVGMM
jgi:hypothetical protein